VSHRFELPVAVGMKAVSGLSPIEQERLKAPGKVFRPPPPMRMPSSPTVSHATASTRNSRASALHGIMDQGGLVELVPDHRRQASTSIVTRTLGDPSTGTDAGAGTLQGVTHSPIRPPFVEHSSSETTAVDSGSPFATSRTSTEKPTFVALPSPPQFTSLNSQTSLVSSSVNTDEATPRARSTAAPSPPASVTHTFEKGLNVLVVDDDPLTRTLMKRMLTRLGCIVATAENGELALELITAGAPRPTPSSEGVPDSVATSSLAHASSEAGSLLSRAESRFAVVFLDNQYVSF
jgi:osomolarity two-component system, sensor histidine kinase SLN1